MSINNILDSLSNFDLNKLSSVLLAESTRRARTQIAQAAIDTQKITKTDIAKELIKKGLTKQRAYQLLEDVK